MKTQISRSWIKSGSGLLALVMLTGGCGGSIAQVSWQHVWKVDESLLVPDMNRFANVSQQISQGNTSKSVLDALARTVARVQKDDIKLKADMRKYPPPAANRAGVRMFLKGLHDFTKGAVAFSQALQTQNSNELAESGIYLQPSFRM